MHKWYSDANNMIWGQHEDKPKDNADDTETFCLVSAGRLGGIMRASYRHRRHAVPE